MFKIIICLLLFGASVFCKPLEFDFEKVENICGISPALEKYGANNTDRTLEGPVSKLGDWPWVVSLESGGSLCTGTLISDKWVLTAAHCVTGTDATTNDDATVFAASTEHLKGQKLVAEKIFVHQKWNWTFDDVALIQISKVTFTDKISPICLSSKLTNSPKNNSIAVGWGLTWDGHESEDTGLLHEDIIPIRPWQHCKDLPKVLPIDPKTEICAGKGMHAVYHGDSGGPLMEIYKKRFYQVGITSWGTPSEDDEINDHSDFEDIFTLVPAYCDWIAETTNGEVKCE